MIQSKWDLGHSSFCHLFPASWHKLLIILVIILVFSSPSKINISWLCALSYPIMCCPCRLCWLWG